LATIGWISNSSAALKNSAAAQIYNKRPLRKLGNAVRAVEATCSCGRITPTWRGTKTIIRAPCRSPFPRPAELLRQQLFLN
jgi:hypothetical protein